MKKEVNLNDVNQVIAYISQSEKEKKLLINSLNEALDLLSCAGPNRLCIGSDEYFKRLDSLREALGLNND